MNTSLKNHLETLRNSVDPASIRESDPVGMVHCYSDPADIEVAGLIAASLAFGQVVSIRKSIENVWRRLGVSPKEALELPPEVRRSKLSGFVHRVYRGEHIARALDGASEICNRHGSLQAGFCHRLEERQENMRDALADFAEDLRGKNPERGLRHLLPDARAGSACKRLWLYLRWMIRPADGIDFGAWRVSPAILQIPVDTHIHRIGRNLGLTKRNSADWRTSVEITEQLRQLCPEDPVRYDVSLCHFGIAKHCPSRLDVAICSKCVLRPVCVAASSKTIR